MEPTNSTKTTTILQALSELDNALQTNQQSLDLYVIGGFALFYHKFRDDFNTNIDCIGPKPNQHILDLITQIGQNHDLPLDWINWDCSYADSITQFEDIVGPTPFCITNLTHQIHIYMPSAYNLIAMKLMAFDTELITLRTLGQFTRYQDLQDLTSLFDKSEYQLADFETYAKQHMISDKTLKILKRHLINPDGTTEYIQSIQAKVHQQHYGGIKHVQSPTFMFLFAFDQERSESI